MRGDGRGREVRDRSDSALKTLGWNNLLSRGGRTDWSIQRDWSAPLEGPRVGVESPAMPRACSWFDIGHDVARTRARRCRETPARRGIIADGPSDKCPFVYVNIPHLSPSAAACASHRTTPRVRCDLRVTCLATATLSARSPAKVDPIAREDAPATGATARFAGTAARIRHTEGTPTLCARAVALARVATGANWDAIVACILR